MNDKAVCIGNTNKSRKMGVDLIGRVCRVVRGGMWDCFCEFDPPLRTNEGEFRNMWVDTAVLMPYDPDTQTVN